MLPATGPARIVFSSAPRSWALAPPDLASLQIGKGKLSTGPLATGSWMSVEAAVGADAPLRVADASLNILPIVGEISATQVETAAQQQKKGSAVGKAVGGRGRRGGRHDRGRTGRSGGGGKRGSCGR